MDDIEAADFGGLKIEAEREIQVLESKISELRSNGICGTAVKEKMVEALMRIACCH